MPPPRDPHPKMSSPPARFAASRTLRSNDSSLVPASDICNECIDLSATIVEDTAQTTPEESSRRRSKHYERSAEDILTTLPALVRSANRFEGESAGWINRLRERGSDCWCDRHERRGCPWTLQKPANEVVTVEEVVTSGRKPEGRRK